MKDEGLKDILDYCLLCGQDVPVLEHVKKFGHGLYGAQGEHPLSRQQIFDFGYLLKPRPGEILSEGARTRVQESLQEVIARPEMSPRIEQLISRIEELEKLLAESKGTSQRAPTLEPPAGDPFQEPEID